MHRQLRSTRLMREYAEVKSCPVANISVEPLRGEDLNEWHGNITGSEGSSFEDIVVHFVITFPAGYPSFPPRVRMCSYIPHLNILRRDESWEVCLDMLETAPISSVTIPYRYWSSAFSVRSVLVQLTSFILADGQPIEISTGNISRTIAESTAYECAACGHTRTSPKPLLPSLVEVENVPLSFPSVQISGETTQKLYARMFSKRKKQQSEFKQGEVYTDSAQSSTTNYEENAKHTAPMSQESEWITVGRRQTTPSQAQTSTSSRDVVVDSNPYLALKDSLTYSDISNFKNSDGKANRESTAGLMGATDRNMGLFRTLSRDTALAVLSYLSVNDILAVGSTCRGMADMTDDWLVWRTLFATRYPRSALSPSGTTLAWRIAYILEANCLSQDLTCFHSLSTKADSVLGFPITYTTNPKTGSLDYVTSTFDILSLESFKSEGVRRTVWGEKFTSFLPIFLDKEHFDKGLATLISTCSKVVKEGTRSCRQQQSSIDQNWRRCKSSSDQSWRRCQNNETVKQEPILESAWTPHTDPEMVLCVITKMMNTQVVLLMDKGVAVSDVALTGYCQLHRLLLGVVDKFPQLRALVRCRLDDFVKKPEKRVKKHTPSLGELLSLLSVSDTYSWKSIAMIYIKESFDRSVLWACSRDPSLAIVTPGDESRLEKYFEVQKVSMRLTLFHSLFLSLLVNGGGSRSKLDYCIDRYDTFQGRPPLYIRRQWQRSVESILTLESWPQFFEMSGIPLPSKSQLLLALETAVGNSLNKGYHSRDTIFQNVMRSGVSRILLKGESYSAAPNLRNVQMLEKWKFDGPVIYLDASCLIYDFSGNHVGTVDYSSSSWGKRYCRSAAVRHSGDVIDEHSGIGSHTINIDMSKLPSSVASLFFTVSAWTTSLKEIFQPSAHLHDPDSDTEMCRYKLEDNDTADKTAVIMCKLHRPHILSKWELTSIGHVCYGRAQSYGPLLNEIRNFL
mmetsp:Transcript_819/g.1380  ORF Transcript_819/g.1380 Transcript_819/m.1380 type:complete len:963 (-) Transcript_819:80-2968(-)